MEKLRVSFIGTGSMGGAVLSGLIASGHPKELISATVRTETSAQKLRSMGISALSTEDHADANSLLAADADLIVLGVKPYQIQQVLEELRGEIGRNSVVISMAAGIRLSSMAQGLPENPNLIRTMPNTPALVGSGVTGMAAASSASEEARVAARQLFEAVGSVVEVREEQIDALSAISGSGPAWLYYIIEQWEKIAIEQGFSEADAQTLVRRTIAGSIKLLDLHRGEPPSSGAKSLALEDSERMIGALEDADLKRIFNSALDAAVARAREMSQSKG